MKNLPIFQVIPFLAMGFYGPQEVELLPVELTVSVNVPENIVTIKIVIIKYNNNFIYK